MTGFLITVLLTVAALCLFVSILMAQASLKKAAQPATLIVLGCRVFDGKPGKMLTRRLDAAKSYLDDFPDAACIVSGGQGADEICTEASAMSRYLVEKGVSPQRIYLEEQSQNTCQNLFMSTQVIKREHLPCAVAIASDRFHQLRANMFARQNGLVPTGCVCCKTQWFRLPYYWAREIPAIARAYLFKR